MAREYACASYASITQQTEEPERGRWRGRSALIAPLLLCAAATLAVATLAVVQPEAETARTPQGSVVQSLFHESLFQSPFHGIGAVPQQHKDISEMFDEELFDEDWPEDGHLQQLAELACNSWCIQKKSDPKVCNWKKCQGCGFCSATGPLEKKNKLSPRRAAKKAGMCPGAGKNVAVPTCAAEVTVRHWLALQLQNKTGSRNPVKGPQFVRMVFHDALDYNNVVGGSGGGVDGCLHSPNNDKGQQVVEHNRNLPVELAQTLQAKFGCSVSFADIEVLGAVTAIKAQGKGPEIAMRWGRKHGGCSKAVSCELGKGCTSDAKVIQTAPIKGFDPAGQRAPFAKLGLTERDRVALMGAHTFGQLQVCAGGFNGIEHGNFCADRAKLDPPDGTGGVKFACSGSQCRPLHHFVFKGNGPKSKGKGAASRYEWGDGGFFDMTPQVFDNNYFQLIRGESFEAKDVCCGKRDAKGKCMRDGGAPVNATSGERVANGLCSAKVNWCQSNRKGRTHLKSTKMWAAAHPSFSKQSQRHGHVKRLIRLGADWSLLGADKTAAIVDEFADDERAFFRQFVASFGKVAQLGSSASDLRSCRAVACAGLKCGGVQFGSCVPSAPESSAKCSLVAGAGGDGVLQCGDKNYTCAVKA